jgi:hypothetical protein
MTDVIDLAPGVAAGPRPGSDAVPIEDWVTATIDAAPNRALLQRQLDAIAGQTALVRFLHRFVLFNDALAARVPFLAGLIHLTPDLFVDPAEGVGFCRQANGRVAAYVAEAASDEYRVDDAQFDVHQRLSQNFLNGALEHLEVDKRSFDLEHPLPGALRGILHEARARFLEERADAPIFRALGFHVGLEFFAHQEFNLVDGWLRASHPTLVAALEQRRGKGCDYDWLAIHTEVEIGHYRAGLEALKAALRFYRDPARRPAMADLIKEGFNGFIELQSRYYAAILDDPA